MLSPRHLSLTAVLPLAAMLFIVSCGKPEEKEPDPPVTGQTPVIKPGAATFPGAGGNYEVAVTVENPANGASLSAKLVYPDGEASGWATLGTPTSTGVPVVLADNLSASRTARLEISYPKAETVTVDLVQEQWNYPEFEIAISKVGPFGATFDIKRKSGYGGGYFFEVLDKADFDKHVKGEKNKVGDFDYGESLYQADLQYLKNMANRHGHSLSALFGMIPGMYSKEASVTMPYSGLAVESEYVFVVYGMEDSDAATRKTPMCFYAFKTGFSTASALTFTGTAADVTENYAEITVTPSNNTEYWYMDWVSEIQLNSTTPAEVMQRSIDNAKTLLSRYTPEQILCHGPETLQARDLMPGTAYTVFAWGMNTDMVATTEPREVFTFHTKDYEIVDDCTFQIEVLHIEDMDVQVRVTPTNLSTRYYVAFVAANLMEGYTDEQAAQRIINMEAQRIENHYYNIDNLSWANLPGLEAGVREIWGRKDEGWTFTPERDYHIYVFGIDNFGIRSTGVARVDVTTAPAGASSNTFTVTIDKATWQGVDYTVTPSNDEDYWMPFMIETAELGPYRNADGSLKEKEIMHEIEEYYENEINYNTYRGTRQLHQHVIPDTHYTILVFGYAGTYTTSMYEWEVYAPAPPLGKSEADYTYTYELFRGEDLSALDSRVWPLVDYEGDCIMLVRMTPNEKAVHWYWGIWGPEENYKDQGGQYYLMTLDMNDTVSAVDKRVFRIRPWWYGATKDWTWVDKDGEIVNHWPWSISGWAEDADGNYGPWHYELMIPVPVPKGQETGKYEVGYTEAYDFWSNPEQTGAMKVFRASTGESIVF